MKYVEDKEAGVFIATSDEVPGLVAEAKSLDELDDKVLQLVPDLLDRNHRLLSGTNLEELLDQARFDLLESEVDAEPDAVEYFDSADELVAALKE